MRARRTFGVIATVCTLVAGFGAVNMSPAGALELNASVCVVVGTVTVTRSDHVPPALGGPLPPGGVPYTLTGFVVVCVGGIDGPCQVASTGVALAADPVGSFSGGFYLDCHVQVCTGSLGGPEALPGGVPGPFSFTVGPLMVGSINDLDCEPVLPNQVRDIGGHNDGSGVLSLIAVPDPTCVAFAGNHPIVPGAPTGIAYCNLHVAGAGVIVS